MAYSRYVSEESERRTGAGRPQVPLGLRESRSEQDQAEFELRATYPINTGDLRSPLDVEAMAQHRIAPYVLERAGQEHDRWTLPAG